MKYLNILVIFAMAMALGAIATSATSTTDDSNLDQKKSDYFSDISTENHAFNVSTSISSLRGASGSSFRHHKIRSQMTCNKNPRMCKVKGSPGPDCCKKKCVNVLEDRLNCGSCGKKCKYWQICCKGNCVNPSVNNNHCGGCFNMCDKGDSCVYGMCSYT